MYDAVYLFAKALHDLDASQQIDINPINCDSAVDTFSHGFSLINYMKVASFSFCRAASILKTFHQTATICVTG